MSTSNPTPDHLARDISLAPEESIAPFAQTPATPSGRRGILSPLRRGNFSLLFSGQLISVLGDQVYSLALPWTVLAVTGDARNMALVLTAEAAPRALLLLFGGALSDRLNPRVVMLTADILRMLVVGALGITLFFGMPPLWVVSVLAGLQGVGSGLFGPGPLSLLPRILSDDELPAGNGLMQIVQFSTLAIGPLLGGVATAAQATFAFLADAASFAVSAVTLSAVRLPRRSGDQSAGDSQKGHLLGDIRAGIAYTFRQPLIRSTMAVTIFANLGLTGTLGVALIVLSRNLSPSPITLGLMLSSAGVGGILGGLGSPLLARVPHRGVVTLTLYTLSGVILGVIPLIAGRATGLPFTLDISFTPTQRIICVALGLGLIGLIIGLGDTVFLTIMQQRIAPEFLARVFSLQILAGSIVGPLSLVGSGYLTAAYGPGVTFLAGAGAMVVAMTIGFLSREIRRI